MVDAPPNPLPSPPPKKSKEHGAAAAASAKNCEAWWRAPLAAHARCARHRRTQRMAVAWHSRALMHSFSAMSERLICLVSAIRSFEWFFESAARSDPARSMMYSAPLLGVAAPCCVSALPGMPTVMIATPWDREDSSFRSWSTVG